MVKKVAVNRSVFVSYWENMLLILSINSILVTLCLLLISGTIFPALLLPCSQSPTCLVWVIKKIRSIIQVIAAIANVRSNLWLILLYGLYVTIWTIFTSDSLLALCLTVASWRLDGLDKKQRAEADR